MASGVCRFQLLLAPVTAQRRAHAVRCSRCPTDNEDNVVKVLVRMGLDFQLPRDLVLQLENQKTAPPLPLEPFDVAGGDVLRAQLTTLIGRAL